MKKKIISFTLLAVAFIFVVGSLSWADSYRSEHHYYYGDKHRPRYDHKPPRHYQKNHYKKPGPKNYSRAYDRRRPPRQEIHVYNEHVHVYNERPQHIYNQKHPAYYDRHRQYGPSHARSGFYFGTSIYEPGLSMGFHSSEDKNQTIMMFSTFFTVSVTAPQS
jgi:hypothetical protein